MWLCVFTLYGILLSELSSIILKNDTHRFQYDNSIFSIYQIMIFKDFFTNFILIINFL